MKYYIDYLKGKIEKERKECSNAYNRQVAYEDALNRYEALLSLKENEENEKKEE